VSTLLRRAFERLETALTLLSSAILFGLMFYVTAEVLMRYVLNRPLPGHLELTQLLIAPAVFLALSWVQAQRGHVGMDLLHERLSPRGRAMADCVTLTLALGTFVVITWFSASSTWTAWEVGDVTPTSNITTWWSRAAVAVGSALLCVRLLMQLVENLGTLLRPRPV
jgi:TRAP-type C4-dicarboxylate transport system permease small subunit